MEDRKIAIPIFYTISDDLNEICSSRIKLLPPRWDAMPNDFDPEMVGKILHDPQNWFHVKQKIKVTL